MGAAIAGRQRQCRSLICAYKDGLGPRVGTRQDPRDSNRLLTRGSLLRFCTEFHLRRRHAALANHQAGERRKKRRQEDHQLQVVGIPAGKTHPT